MSQLVFALLAVGAGFCIALQAPANSRLRQHIGGPDGTSGAAVWAAFFSISGTILTAAVAVLVLRPTTPSAEAVRQTEWWNWLGGPLGALFVLAGAALVSELGSAMYIALVVAGQLTCALLVDHYALMGLKETPVTVGRVFGAGLVVAGVVCVKYL